MKVADDDNKMTVLSAEDTPPSRPGPKFFAIVLVVMAGIAYLVFWPSIKIYIGL
jgi:hypothetical protein